MAAAPPAQPSYLPPTLQRLSSATATLTIPNLVGHRRRLWDVFVEAASSSYVDIAVGNVTMLRIYDNLPQATLIGDLTQRHERYGFLWMLSRLIPDFPIINASQDEPIVIKRADAPVRMHAYWEDIEGGDVTSRTLPGGSLSSRHPFILNLSNPTAISASGRYDLTRLDMPDGLTVFSDGTRMAPNIRFTVHAIAGNFPKAGGSKATRLHIMDERIELFTSENKEGLFIDPDEGSEIEFSLRPLRAFVLEPPYVFNPNRLLTFTIEATYDGTNALPAGSQQLFLIGIREFLGPG